MLRQILFGLCLALFSGMRPGETFALQLKHIADDHVEVVHRIYRSKLDRPKSERVMRRDSLSLPMVESSD